MIGIESAPPFLVHGDSGPPFRVGELCFKAIESGASLFAAVTCEWDKSTIVEGEGDPSTRTIRSTLDCISRSRSRAKVPGAVRGTTGARPTSDAGTPSYWVIGDRSGLHDTRSRFSSVGFDAIWGGWDSVFCGGVSIYDFKFWVKSGYSLVSMKSPSCDRQE